MRGDDMVDCQKTAKAGFIFQIARKAIVLVVLALVFGCFSLSIAMDAENRRNTMEEEIWKL
jgi:hypothetical protein